MNRYRKKQVIYQEGNRPSRLYYIQKGKVKTYKTNEDGKDLVIGLYNEGDYLGYVALLEGTSYNETAEAIEETEKMLEVYATFAEEFMALPVIRGVKSVSERFAGALETYCIEALMQDGKALQAGTSHFLGQNFAKAFDVKFLNRENKQEHVWATSWGVSTRLIGALIMAHSDDSPPASAAIATRRNVSMSAKRPSCGSPMLMRMSGLRQRGAGR